MLSVALLARAVCSILVCCPASSGLTDILVQPDRASRQTAAARYIAARSVMNVISAIVLGPNMMK